MAEFLTLPGVKGNFAVGLSWRHEDAAPKQKELRLLAENYGSWGTVFTAGGGGIQVGMCQPIEGLKRPSQAKALAAIVADEHPQPWRGIYDLGDGRVWYIAVRDHQEILPDGDQIGTRDQISYLYAQHDKLGQWTAHDGSVEDLGAIVKSKSKRPALRDFAFNPAKLYIGLGAAALLVFAGLGVLAYLHSQHDKQLALQRAAALRAQAAKQSAEDAAKANFRPWSKMPLPTEVLSACQALWGTQELTHMGWVLSTWTCSADETAVTSQSSWERQGGLAKDAPGDLSTDGNHSVYGQTLPQSWLNLNQDALVGEAAPRTAWTFAQQHGITMSLAPPPAQPKDSPTMPDASNATPPPPWLQYPTVMKFDAAPWLLVHPEQFDEVTGLRLTKIDYDAHGMTWLVTGTLYGMLPVMAPDAAVGASATSGVSVANAASIPSLIAPSVGPNAPVAASAGGLPGIAASSVVPAVAASATHGVSTTVVGDAAIVDKKTVAAKPDTTVQPIGPTPTVAHMVVSATPVAPAVPGPTLSASAPAVGGSGEGALALVKAHQAAVHAPAPPGLTAFAPMKSGG